ncbi:MAG: hypothetical protein RBU37_25840 [Myxococcota bacterium]|jgi:hypothetical protein|nr:hypothetical protein [Myxococcota bacterium]
MQLELRADGTALLSGFALDKNGRVPKAQLFEWGRWLREQSLPDGRPFGQLLCIFEDAVHARAHHQTLRFIGAWAAYRVADGVRKLDDEVVFDVRSDGGISET